jgi:hypothetical protein
LDIHCDGYPSMGYYLWDRWEQHCSHYQYHQLDDHVIIKCYNETIMPWDNIASIIIVILRCVSMTNVLKFITFYLSFANGLVRQPGQTMDTKHYPRLLSEPALAVAPSVAISLSLRETSSPCKGPWPNKTCRGFIQVVTRLSFNNHKMYN